MMRKFITALGFLSSLSLFSSPIFAQTNSEDFPSGYQILGFYGVLEPKPVFKPLQVDFGEIEVGKVKAQNVYILNDGTGVLIFRAIYLEKGDQFAIKNVDCPGKLAPGRSCHITVFFKPTKPGNFTDNLVFVINDSRKPVYKVSLKGSATVPQTVIEKPQTTIVIENIEPTKKEISFKPAESKSSNIQSKPKSAKKKTTKTVNQKYKFYTVKECDTLWDLSYKFYKTPLLWAAIYENNRDKIRDPWFIKPGQVLKIPVNLTPEQIKKYKQETLKLMEEMADRPLGPKCPLR